MPQVRPPQMAKMRSRGMTISEMQRSGQFGDHPPRIYSETSGSMAAGITTTYTVNLNFATQVKVWAVCGAGEFKSSGTGSAVLGFRDAFDIQVSKQNGDKLFTKMGPGHLLLGTPNEPLWLPQAWNVGYAESITLDFQNNDASVATVAWISFICTEER